MKIKAMIALVLALCLVLFIPRGEFMPAIARVSRPIEALIDSNGVKEIGGNPETSVANISQLKNSDSSSRTTASFRFACDPRSHGINQYEGGTVAYCTKKDFEASDVDLALIEIRPGAARAPHWHDTWEQQTLISGKAKTYLIDETGQVQEEFLTPGMVAVLPAGMTHWTETIGDQTSVLSLSFPAGFKTFELSDSLIQVNRSEKKCDPGSDHASCLAKPKRLILILKNGLI